MTRASRHRRTESGQALVEFVLVFPVAVTLIFGLIAGCFAFFQYSAVKDGAAAGARAASIMTSLTTAGTGTYAGQFCESGSPQSIEAAVAAAAPGITVNNQPLCATSSTATQLTQATSPTGDVNITVTCGGTCASPTSTQVSLTYADQGIAPPLNLTYTMQASSLVPVETP